MRTMRSKTRWSNGSLMPPSVAWVSTFPPTTCGLATYTASLIGSFQRHPSGAEARCTVVSLVDEPSAATAAAGIEVHQHQRGDAAALARTVAVLDQHDVVSLQHEFGIYAGDDGAEATDLIDAVTTPTLVTYHTVLREPSARQRRIVTHLARRSARSVVMSGAAAQRLVTHYGVRADRIEVLPHGFDPRLTPPSEGPRRPSDPSARPLALTWGLIGPGKGLEVAIEAFAALTDLDPLPRYRITGATHPGVVAWSGESYRQQLVDQVRERGLQDVVEFDNRYLDAPSLHTQIRSATLIVLPYLSTEQVTSGVLTEAIGAGKPVVATRFPHAVEVLGSGAGVVVQQGDPVAMSAAIRTVLAEPGRAAQMAWAARRVARDWAWPVVAARFEQLARTVASEPPSRIHVARRADPRPLHA
jgi:polysaccharide biosynthesis protein PslF